MTTHHFVKIALRPLCGDDVGSIVQEFVRVENHKKFRQELLEAVYNFQISIMNKLNGVYTDDELERIHRGVFDIKTEDRFWIFMRYRALCFPNEIGCTCCLSGYPGLGRKCKKKWAKNQRCTCIIDLENEKYCKCDCPFRRYDGEPINAQPDPNEQDYEFFQNLLNDNN